MQSADEPSIQELRAESERSRAALAVTVTALRERVGDAASELKTLASPSHIKQELRDYMRQERETFSGALQRRARESPLQVAAIGAAVALPALGLLRALPAPLWLIGAGLFLTSRTGQRAARDVKAKVDDAVGKGAEHVSDLASSMQSEIEDRVAGARYGLEDARDTVSATVDAMSDKARAAFHDARDAVTSAASQTAAAVGDSAAGAGETVGNLSQKASQTAQSVKNSVLGVGASSRTTITDFVNGNALLVAGIAVAVGAFMAASIPSSDAENRLFGAGSEKLKNKARETAADGIEKAGDIAADVAGAAAAVAAHEGLDASGVKAALGKVADSVRAVTDRGLDTALGQGDPQSMPDQQPVSSNQENHHE